MDNSKTFYIFLTSIFSMLLLTGSITAAPVVRTASGPNAAAILATVDQFRADLGANNGIGGSFTSGRREINWDGSPDSASAPNNMAPNAFLGRGAMFTTPCSNAIFRLSADSTNPTNTPVRFGEIDPSYTTTFTTFSAQRLFTVISNTAVPCNIVTVNFFIPGTQIPATVSGFGVVFTDVDVTGTGRVICYDAGGNLLAPGAMAPNAANGGLSFVGVSYNAGERISQCQIVSGTDRLNAGNVDGNNGIDVVAMDDFIYGEPRAAQYHASDFDGDGTSDYAVFRPSTGQWFILNSGSNTFTGVPWGVNGDIPVDGDFDGDQRSDFAIFRPSTGQWFSLNSSNGSILSLPFGQNGDKPVPGDYDKDGKTDIAVWRPSNGVFFSLNSSAANGTVKTVQWGMNGDIPLASAGQ